MTKEQRKIYNRKYRQTSKGKEGWKKYSQSPKGKEVLKKGYKKWIHSPKGYEIFRRDQKRYQQSPKGKKTRKEYSQSPKGKESLERARIRFFCSPKGKECRRINNVRRRKQFGFIPLNESFEGCEGHHIDLERIIYIPKKLHRSIWHSLILNVNMDKINELAFDYLKLENKAKYEN